MGEDGTSLTTSVGPIEIGREKERESSSVSEQLHGFSPDDLRSESERRRKDHGNERVHRIELFW